MFANLAIQPDRPIVVAGASAVARLLPGEQLDASFARDGLTTTELGGPSAISDIEIQADGKIPGAKMALRARPPRARRFS